ncbi:MAG: sulfite exporter TauE/SafE family protein [Coriobacteriia bacterium]|nr:sulfite exporter TauE/SafE family protein [Coriobacteriia bacterium]
MNLFFPMLVTGLFTGFHCVMMCGNMVLSYAVKGSEEGTFFQRMKPHFAYHFAKIVSYTLVGLFLGSIGNFISTGARSWVSIVAGFYMILLGLQMTGKFPVLNYLQPKPPKFIMNMLSKLRRKAMKDASEDESSLVTPVSFGLMTGLMPCGPLIAAQVAAAGSGSTISGGLAMLGFGLGTVPVMLAYGAFASVLGVKFKKYMAVGGAIVIILLGGVMMNRGATALGLPVNFNVVKTAVVGKSAVSIDESKFKKGADGVIEVPMVVEGQQYKPSTLVIPADKPVRLIVNRKDANACSKELLFPKLGIRVSLKDNGVTVINLPATAAGDYQMSCQMGMITGTLQVGAAGATKRPVLVYVIGVVFLLLVIVIVLNLRAKTSGDVPSSGKKSSSGKRSPSGKKSSSGKKSPSAKEKDIVIFGFDRLELVFVLAALVLSVALGLAVGGFFG